jgi:hypothetical protein
LWHGGPRADKIATHLLCEGPFFVNTANGRVDLRQRTLVYKPQNRFQADLYLLVTFFDRARICAWPQCNTRYFIVPPKNRLTMRFCSAKCRNDALLAAKRKSWQKNKSRWKKGKK